MTKVKVGQIWADNDKRHYGRQIRIVRVDVRYADVENVDSGRRSRVLLSRFWPTRTGYRLVSDVDGAA